MTVAPPAPPPVSGRRTFVAAALAALAAPLLFAAVTGAVWEDYYITFRSSRNLAEGHGLVYQPGEAVHTFTSPLGVLLPALGLTLTGSDAGALWFFRIVSALALAGAALLVVNHARDQGWPRAVVWFALCLGLFEAKAVAFSANGMETALLLFFAALTWHELTRTGGPRRVALAAGFGGLMWSRPDAFVLGAAMTFAWWVCGPRRLVPDERAWWRGLAPALLVGGLLYAPWFFWAWHYYGSPVPQTIIAKSALSPGFSVVNLLTAPFRCLAGNTPLDGLFTPIYATSGWPANLLLAGKVMARLAAFLWLVPVLPRATRAASLAVLLGGVYLSQIMSYPWYYAPWTLLGALALGGAAWSLGSRLPVPVRGPGRIGAGIIAGSALALTLAQGHGARLQQQIIEEDGRKQIGLWLKAHARPGDRVFLEPIGYIGYFSQLKILDYPGLCAPEVSRIVRSGPGGYARLITTLQPDWVVLRPYEIAHQNLADSGMLDPYDAVKISDQRPAVEACTYLPGRNWLEFDAQFIVYHRRPAGAIPAGRTP